MALVERPGSGVLSAGELRREESVSKLPRVRALARGTRLQARRIGQILSAPLRRAYYMRGAMSLAKLPTRFRDGFGLDDQSGVFSRRIEIGSGFYPSPGYIHVDLDTRAPHVEYFSSGARLPFRDDWAEEILAIHVLEHVHPTQLFETLGEWRRVLAPGGLLRLHVPDSRALMEGYLEASQDHKWSLMGGLLGMYANADINRPEQLQKPPDHKILFDRALLTEVLSEAGFVDVRDLSALERDRHTGGWESLLPQISLIFEARKAVPRTSA